MVIKSSKLFVALLDAILYVRHSEETALLIIHKTCKVHCEDVNGGFDEIFKKVNREKLPLYIFFHSIYQYVSTVRNFDDLRIIKINKCSPQLRICLYFDAS